MSQNSLQNRVAVITGGARGIGLAAAKRMLESGASVALWDLDADRLAQTRQQLEALGKVTAHALDLTDLAAVENAAADTLRQHGKVDILVNNAGITGGNGVTWELDPAVWQQVVQTNLMAPYYTCRVLVPAMLKNGYGRIVNIASIAGKEGNPNASHYSASKAGLIGLTKSLGKELAERNILVNAITPAAAKTEIFDSMSQEHIDYMLSRIPMKRFLAVDEAASMICWLSSEECAFSTGAVFDLSGGRATY